MATKINQPLFENAVKDYLESCTSARLSKNIQMGIPEFEVRFGQERSITKIDYDNVVKELYLNKWNTEKIDGTQLLRISPKLEDKSKIRLELEGADMIEIYCKTNSFEALKHTPASHKKIKFMQKQPIKIGMMISGEKKEYIDYPDFDFRISSQNELSFPITSDADNIRKIIGTWNPTKKFFRCMNRTRFSNPDSIVFVDVSIVKSNRTYNNSKNALLCQTIQEANIFHNPEKYEIELELNNQKITEIMDNYTGRIDSFVQKVIQEIRKCIRIVLTGLQGTPYPISYVEQEEILKEYMTRITPILSNEDNIKISKYPIKPYFVGPSSITLQTIHVAMNQDSSIPNIALDYTVTEKADGERALLYISKNGKIYMIRTNLSIVFTGAITETKECWDSLLDGEYIAYNKTKTFLNLFAAFDIYYIGSRKNGSSVRELAFCTNNITLDETQFRLPLLEKFIQKLNIQSIVGKDATCIFQIRSKTFYKGLDSIIPKESEDIPLSEQTIFQASEIIWNRKENYEYVIDGLIYTPMNTGVGSDKVGKAHELGKKFTWDRSFKWKPPHYNTIDFLVNTKKDKYGKEIISNKIILDDKGEISSILQYKTLILKCGFNPKIHKYVNAFSDVLFNRSNAKKQGKDEEEEKGYQPVPFQPTSPYDKDACFCNVLLEDQQYMRTSENEIFQDNMIVEFSFDTTIKETETAWKWVPLRVRFDKTSELRANKNNFGNDYTVANNNWHSIHFPITEKMIIGQDMITTSDLDDTVYYNRKDKDSVETQALKDFHNLFVKRYIINKIAKYLHEKMHVSSILLIDYAVGKCGDLPKWIEADIKFIFGIDISKDNIMNARDGACVRYLNKKKEKPNLLLNGVFLHGNSSLNILSTQKAFYTEQEKEVAKAIFGQGGIDAAKNIAEEYVGIGRDKFHISSCQFAMHYFFENNKTLHSFLRNLTECTRVNGFFIGTCYDGKRVFDLLRNKLKGQSIRLDKNGKKIFEITKEYANELEIFPDNEKSIGIPIYVYQETIDKTFMEYLVNFQYFDTLMENYGFVNLNKAENESIGFINSISNGSFEQLFHVIEKESRNKSLPSSSYGKSLQMSKEEKTISFLNRYFVYKKVRDITLQRIEKIYSKYVENTLGNDNDDDDNEQKENEKEDEKKREVIRIRKIPNKKITLSLQNYHPISEGNDEDEEEEKEKDEEKEEEEKEGEYGEYQSLYNGLTTKMKDTISKYTREKQLEILKKLEKQKKTKIVVAKK
jgi:hypothetical protein